MESIVKKLRKKGLVKERLVALSPYFKNYNIPFSFEMPESEDELGTECIGSKIYRFGVLSFCYKISVSAHAGAIFCDIVVLKNI